MVNQPYQNWVGRVLEASNSFNRFASSPNNHKSLSEYIESPLQIAADRLTYIIDPITHRLTGGGSSIAAMYSDKYNSLNLEDGLVSGTFGRPVPLRKMLFSATLTRDPQKLAKLGLVNPKHFDANSLKRTALMEGYALGSHDSNEMGDGENKLEAVKTVTAKKNSSDLENIKMGRYFVPEGLTERMVECTAEQKPLVLLALLLDEERDHISSTTGKEDAESVNLSIVFTSSVDSTHRLARLLQLLWEAGGFGQSSAIAEFSSSISANERAAILRRCRNSASKNRVSVLVCSDGMSRGMDLPSVSAVINYDVPAFAKTYVHRCGRTARAGRKGKAISVLKGGQISKFRKMRSMIDGGAVEKIGIKKDLVRGVLPTYKACVSALKQVLHAEENEELHPSEPLDGSFWIPTK